MAYDKGNKGAKVYWVFMAQAYKWQLIEPGS